MTVQVLRRRFTVDEYYRMAEAGILHEDDRIELIEGEIVEMAPIGSRHAANVTRLNSLFNQKLWPEALISVQNPIRLDEHSEPQSDVTLLRPRPDFYASAHPGPQDILLVVEVADTSIAYDRGVKLPLYARHGIPEVWLVSLDEKVVEVYRGPGPQGYQDAQRLKPGDRITLEAFPEVGLQVDDVFPPAS